MTRLAGWVALLAVLVLSIYFAALHGGQRVTLRLGVATFYRVPLSVVVFGSVVLGMTAMLVAGIRSDLKVRRILRDRLAREDVEERARILADRHQRDLFDHPEETARPAAAAPPSPEPPHEIHASPPDREPSREDSRADA